MVKDRVSHFSAKKQIEDLGYSDITTSITASLKNKSVKEAIEILELTRKLITEETKLS